MLTVFFCCAASCSIAIPLWEAPDEPEHFQYVRYLAERHTLPSQLPTIQTDGNNEGKQPPLYYLLALPSIAGINPAAADRIRLNPHAGWPATRDGLYAAVHVVDEGWPYHGIFLAAHRARLLSALLGTVTVALTYGVAKTCIGSRGAGLLAAALVALLPGFVFGSATLNNDALADTLAAALLLIAVRAGPQWAGRYVAGYGVVAALALLAKLDTVVPIIVGLIAVGLKAAPARRFQAALLVAPLLSALAFWGWRISHGERRLVGRLVGWPPAWQTGPRPPDWSAPAQFAVHLWTSFFGVFGWQSVPLPSPLYAIYGLVLIIGLGSATLAGRSRPVGAPVLRDGTLLCCWAGAILASMVAVDALVIESRVGYDNSRLFYPALPAVATLIAFGWSRLAAGWPGLRLLALPALAGGQLLAFGIPWLLIHPIYPAPWPVDDRVPDDATPVAGGRFAGGVELAAVRLPTGAIGAGQGIYVTFYWRVQRPLPNGEWLFVHVEDGGARTAAAFDGVPSSSTLPPASWRQGDVITETEVLTFHQDAKSGNYAVKVGWYDPHSGARIPLAAGGSEAVAGTVQVVAAGAEGGG